MTKNSRVLNITRGYSLRYKQAFRAVENCSATWVEYGISIRDLTLRETIAARSQQVKQREPLPAAEIPGLIYQPSVTGQTAHNQGKRLVAEASKFLEQASG